VNLRELLSSKDSDSTLAGVMAGGFSTIEISNYNWELFLTVLGLLN
jgi:hypothetical protein